MDIYLISNLQIFVEENIFLSIYSYSLSGTVYTRVENPQDRLRDV